MSSSGQSVGVPVQLIVVSHVQSPSPAMQDDSVLMSSQGVGVPVQAVVDQ